MTRTVPLTLLTLLGAGLLLSYAGGGPDSLWFGLDEAVFFFFNTRLVSGSTFLTLTAYANLRLFDLVSFAAMAALYTWYFIRADNAEKRRMLAVGVLMLLTAVSIKQAGRLLPWEHASPTLFFDGVNRLRDLAPIGAKDADGNSFPGDHGMMLMIFAAFLGRYKGWIAFLAASALVVFFSLPRIAGGAHWFGDIYAGSLGIACITLGWLLLTPASDRAVEAICRLLPARLFPLRA